MNTYAVKSETDFWSINDVRSNKGTRLLDAWSPTNPDSNIPAITALNANDEGRMSTYFVENGSFLKLRNLQLGSVRRHILKSAVSMSVVRICLLLKVRISQE